MNLTYLYTKVPMTSKSATPDGDHTVTFTTVSTTATTAPGPLSLQEDHYGAMVFIIATVCVYGMSIVFFIAGHLQKRQVNRDEEKQISRYLKRVHFREPAALDRKFLVLKFKSRLLASSALGQRHDRRISLLTRSAFTRSGRHAPKTENDDGETVCTEEDGDCVGRGCGQVHRDDLTQECLRAHQDSTVLPCEPRTRRFALADNLLGTDSEDSGNNAVGEYQNITHKEFPVSSSTPQSKEVLPFHHMNKPAWVFTENDSAGMPDGTGGRCYDGKETVCCQRACELRSSGGDRDTVNEMAKVSSTKTARVARGRRHGIVSDGGVDDCADRPESPVSLLPPSLQNLRPQARLSLPTIRE